MYLDDLKLPGELLLPRCPQINECFHRFGWLVYNSLNICGLMVVLQDSFD